MEFKLKIFVSSRTEAQQLAIDFQNWASEQNLSYGELAIYQEYFRQLADNFALTDEFKENGII